MTLCSLWEAIYHILSAVSCVVREAQEKNSQLASRENRKERPRPHLNFKTRTKEQIGQRNKQELASKITRKTKDNTFLHNHQELLVATYT